MMCSGFRRNVVVTALLGFLFFAPASWATTTASRSAPYPNYEVGDLASLVVSTSPAQPSAPVYMYRLKNGAPDGPQPTLVGTTDTAGRFEVLNVPLPASQVGEFSAERYAVGSPSATLSSPLAFRIDASSAPTVTRATPFPSYQVGDTASVTVRTFPAQTNQPVYRWRLRNGAPDGAQPTQVGTTNSSGRLTITAVLPASSVGSYTGERYAVGTNTGPRSPSASYTIAPAPNAPTVTRADPFPDYQVGDTAVLEITTLPVQANAPVYRWRSRNGAPDGPQPLLVGTTDAAGRFTQSAPLVPGVEGSYTGERYSVGRTTNPRSTALNFTIAPAPNAPNVTRPAPFPNYRVGDTAVLQITTNPAQADAPVYQWRLKDGLPDGPQPQVVGTTTTNGTFTQSAALVEGTEGTYTDERFAVGRTTNPSSPAQSFTIGPALQAPTVSRPAPFPDYQVGDTATLTLSTDPVQANAPVYQWRLKDGLPDGPQPTAVGTTSADGSYSVSVTLAAGSEGTYTQERFAVGSPNNPKSPARSFTVLAAPNVPTVTRAAPFPDYQIGDTAKLTLTTDPVQPHAPVYRWRWHDGRPEWPLPAQEGTTDASGRFEVEVQLAPGVEGSYSRERYAVGRTTNPRSPALSFTISPAPNAPTVSRPSPFPHYQVGDTATLTIATDPPQPDAPVYRWRLLDGKPDGQQPTLVGTTTSAGTFTQSAGLPASVAGSYTGEQYAVGRETNPRSSSLSFDIWPANPNPGVPIVERPAPFPNYTVGDTARLVLRTDPRQPNQPVYRSRLKDGEPDGPQPHLEGTTDDLGRLEIEALLPAEAEGLYTEEQYAVGDPSGPLSPPQSFAVASAGPTGELRFDTITPNTVATGGTTVVTLRGENFTQKSTVRLLDETGDGASGLAAGKSATSGTTATVLSVTPDGREMRIEIDATSSQAMDAFGMIAVDNGLGEKAQPLRVVGPEPIVDAWRPGETARGTTYVLNLVGVHLAETSIVPPAGVSLQVQEQTDQQVTGLLTIGADAPLGEQFIQVQGATTTVQVPFTIAVSASPASKGTNMLLGTQAETDARAAGKPVPELLVQPLVIGEHLRSRVDPLRQQRPLSKVSCFVGGARWTLIDLTAQVAIVVDLDNGTVGAITRTLGLGSSVNLGSYVLSFSLKVDLTFSWIQCSNGFGDLSICLEYDYEIEIPGRVWRYERGTCYTIGVITDDSVGETTRLEFIGGPCAQADNDPVDEGIATATVTQTACCEQNVAFEAEGFSFGQSFSRSIPQAVVTTALCSTSGTLRLFLDVDDDNPFSTTNAAPIDDLDDLPNYLPGAAVDGTSVADLSSSPQSMMLVAAYFDVVSGTATVVPPPTGVTAITFDLSDTSAFVGVATNWPVSGGSTAPDFHLVGGTSPTQASVAFGADHTARVELVAGDYGGFTNVSASPDGGVTVETVRIPVDADGNLLPDAGWRTVNGASVPPSGNPDADDDYDPVTAAFHPSLGMTGDGLSSFEEFRGFMVRGQHRRTHPARKDLFLSSNAAVGIRYAYPNLPMSVHRIRGEDESAATTEYAPGRVINPNQANGGFGGDVPGSSPQRAVRIIAKALPPTTPPFTPCTYGAKFPLSGETDPNTTDKVEVYTGSHVVGCIPGASATDLDNELRRSLGHEVGHALHVCHYPSSLCPNPVSSGSIMDSGVFLGINGQSDAASKYNSDDVDQIRLHQNP